MRVQEFMQKYADRIAECPKAGRVRFSLPNGRCRLLAGDKDNCLDVITTPKGHSSFFFSLPFSYLVVYTMVYFEEFGSEYSIEWL